jgi:hypothetical protein
MTIRRRLVPVNPCRQIVYKNRTDMMHHFEPCVRLIRYHR